MMPIEKTYQTRRFDSEQKMKFQQEGSQDSLIKTEIEIPKTIEGSSTFKLKEWKLPEKSGITTPQTESSDEFEKIESQKIDKTLLSSSKDASIEESKK